VLDWAVARAADTAGVRLEAARLDYNLLTLTAGVTDLTVASVTSPGVPFFEAARVDVTFDGAVLGGELRFAEIAVVGGRVAVVQAVDGTTNLPEAGGGGGPPPAIVIDRLTLEGLAVAVDAPNLSLDLPRLDAELTPMTGSLALGAPATIDVGGTRTVISAVDGEAAFDGRAVRVRDLAVTTDDVAAILDGRVEVLVDEPAYVLDVQATGALDRLARWGGLVGDEAPGGTVTLSAEVRGPLTAPALALTASVPRLAWRTVVLDDVRAEARVDATGLDLESLTLTAAGGTANATGGVGFGTLARIDLEAGWEGVDIAGLLAQLAPEVALPLAGQLAGTARLTGPLDELEAWDGAVALEVTAPAGGGRGAGRGRAGREPDAGRLGGLARPRCDQRARHDDRCTGPHAGRGWCDRRTGSRRADGRRGGGGADPGHRRRTGCRGRC
jgi:hypothetical protein